MTPVRALVVGNVGSFRDCWTFRRRIAEKVGCSVRTVARALAQATSLGLIGVARAKPNEKAPGIGRVVPCGWSHRWAIGWGRAGAAVKRAIETARARFTLRRASRPMPREGCAPKARHCGGKAPQLGRTWTAAELDAELALVPRTPNVPERPPPE
jgi:hypothetical protein